VTSDHPGEHLVPLPGTDWTIWRDALLRTAGFPAAGLDRFAAPGCAEVADAFLDGQVSEQNLRAAHDAALADSSKAAAGIAADPLFQEALTWQNPAARPTLSLATASGQLPGSETRRARQKRRFREDTIARYWQRYCGKNDTIGFFGPATWVRLDPDGPAVSVRGGDKLVKDRATSFEFWLLETYAQHLAADPLVRPWLPAGLHPDLTLDGCRVLRPGEPPVELTEAEADLLRRCDGRTAMAICDPSHQAGDLALLEALTAKDVVWWGVDMPYNPLAEQVLRDTLAAIPDPVARERAMAGLRRLDAAREGVSAAAGDPDALVAALGVLDAEFTAVTGAEPQRRPGQMYAGRRLCYEDASRDIDLAFGKPVLEALSGPLGRVLLPAARWASGTVADAFDVAFRSLYDELRPPQASSVPMSQFWDAAQRLFTRSGHPVDTVATELARRWKDLFGLDRLAPGTRQRRRGGAGSRAVPPAAAALARGPDTQPRLAYLCPQHRGDPARGVQHRAGRTARQLAHAGQCAVHRPAPRAGPPACRGRGRHRTAVPPALPDLVASVHRPDSSQPGSHGLSARVHARARRRPSPGDSHHGARGDRPRWRADHGRQGRQKLAAARRVRPAGRLERGRSAEADERRAAQPADHGGPHGDFPRDLAHDHRRIWPDRDRAATRIPRGPAAAPRPGPA
jgi:hypothetical protein